jgi:uncharacterized protein (TIGR02271 family)
MAQTVIGMFESSSKAQEAVQELVQSGISRDRIDVSANNSGSSYSSDNMNSDDDRHESGISKFFKNLFGNDDDDADKYTRVASNAQCIVTVHAQSSDEAENAADILDDNGAVDVDEHASRLGYSTGGSNSYGSTGSGMGTSMGSSGGSNLATDTTTGLAAVGGSTGLTGTGGTDFAGSAGMTGGTDYTGSTGSGLAGGTDLGGNMGSTDYSSSAGSGLRGDTDLTNSTGSMGSAGTTGYTGSGLGNNEEETSRIPIIEENLEVGKREVRTGGVRVRSRIVERPVEESLRLREERVNIERNPVDRPATAADLQNFQERDIEMVERSEVPVVNKEARVVEEVNIAKNVEERNETIQDTVRKTEVDVENLDTDATRGRSSTNNSSL